MTTKPATNVYLDDDIKAAVIQWAKRNRLSMSAAINIMCTSTTHVVTDQVELRADSSVPPHLYLDAAKRTC